MIQRPIKKLLDLLANHHWHSSAALSKQLSVTRSAVRQMIAQLRNACVAIETLRGKGYRLTEDLELLDLEKIATHLPSKYQSLLQKTTIFDLLPSTNTYLLERARQNNITTLLCLAEHQSMGRGRFNRQWISAFGRNIYLSALWSATLDCTKFSALSLVVAVSVVRALRKMGIHEGIGLKWPNDIQWHGKKLVGILIDVHHAKDQQYHFIIGIGVNVAQPAIMKWSPTVCMTDIFDIIQKKPERNQLVAVIITSLFDALAEFVQHGFAAFISEWLALDVTLDRPVKLLINEQAIYGIYRGIDTDSGALLLEDEQGQLHHYLNGEVSLRTIK
jgi:BirA family biotin operon repressor/biotin-[acetyl-CoA-carboxylase] ligase